MSAHEEDASHPCEHCGVTFDVHEHLAPKDCPERASEPSDVERAKEQLRDWTEDNERFSYREIGQIKTVLSELDRLTRELREAGKVHEEQYEAHRQDVARLEAEIERLKGLTR